MPEFAVILPAGGTSSRFGADKLSSMLAGKSVLDRSIDAFASRADVKLIVVAGRPIPSGSKLIGSPAGACRAETVRNALSHVPVDVDWIAVHDAARPLVSQELIDRVFAEALRFGAAAPALAIELTVKQATGPLPADVDQTVPRTRLWALQTPQVMRRADLAEALARCPIPWAEVTDDLQLLELAGKRVRLVVGEDRNIKITRPIDLQVAELLVQRA